MMNKESLALAKKIADYALEIKASNVIIMEMENLMSVVDAFVIASASSTTQVKAIVDNIDKKMSENGLEPHHMEGYQSAGWVLVDYGWVVVHVFLAQEREFYNIEALWQDAEVHQML